MEYREGMIYKTLESIIKSAGIEIIYEEVPNDSIDGAIWARSEANMEKIMMPDNGNAFPDEETACCILGHEMGHIITGLDSPDIPDQRIYNEAECDKVGVYLYRLAEMIAGNEYEKEMKAAFDEVKSKRDEKLDGAPAYKAAIATAPYSRTIQLSVTKIKQKPGYISVSDQQRKDNSNKGTKE